MTEVRTRTASTRSRKVKALLAGGLVLGVGAAVTLAAWTDQEWAEGVFGAGTFNIEGSVDGTTFTENESEDGAAALSFDLPDSTNLTPGDSVSAPFVIRLDAETTYDAALELTSAGTVDPAPAALTYGIVEVGSAGECTVGATGTSTIVQAGTALSSTEGATAIELTAGAGDADGEPVALCFQVTADSTLDQGETATAHWQFVGTSAE